MDRAAALERKALVAAHQIGALADRIQKGFRLDTAVGQHLFVIIIHLLFGDGASAGLAPIVLIEIGFVLDMTAPVLVGTVAVNLLAQQFRVAVPVTNALDAIASRPLGLFIPILAAVSVLSHLELGGPARRVPDREKQ